ncbi:cation diffusion facilitator family transporter [Faecalimonas sp.]
MTKFLVEHFVKRYEHVEEIEVRTAYGVLSSIVGIVCNILLFIGKGSIGLMMHSVSILADAFNNLSDAGSSIISLVGVKMASKPADEEHPFGHGRIEYISALIVSFLVVQVGLTFLKDSVGKIMNPEQLKFQWISIIILLFSIGMKLWLGGFNRKLGKKINSKVLQATATDSMGDAITTSVTVFSIFFWKITGINIDGIVGLLVSGIVVWAGISIAKDTVEALIGPAPDKEVYRKIIEFVEEYEGIEGTHDLIVHNYGPGKSMASIHAEVPNTADIEVSHEVVDKIERDAQKYLGIFLVIHMDPIEIRDESILEIKEMANTKINEIDSKVSIHDFRVVEGKQRINLIFDMVVPYEYDKEKQNEVSNTLRKELQKVDNRYQCVIHVEKSYGGM